LYYTILRNKTSLEATLSTGKELPSSLWYARHAAYAYTRTSVQWHNGNSPLLPTVLKLFLQLGWDFGECHGTNKCWIKVKLTQGEEERKNNNKQCGIN
jgi:hypothetical protein